MIHVYPTQQYARRSPGPADTNIRIVSRPEGVYKELKTEAYFYFEIRKRIVLNKDINDPRWFLVNMHCALPLL